MKLIEIRKCFIKEFNGIIGIGIKKNVGKKNEECEERKGIGREWVKEFIWILFRKKK